MPKQMVVGSTTVSMPEFTVQVPEPEPVAKIFYSPVRELYIGISAGKLQTLANGTVERFGEKFVRFQPLGDTYGIYKTDDPEIIAALEKRMKDAREHGVKPDVITEGEYSERFMTDEVKLNFAQREIESKNRLLLEEVAKNKALMEEINRFRESQDAMNPTKSE